MSRKLELRSPHILSILEQTHSTSVHEPRLGLGAGLRLARFPTSIFSSSSDDEQTGDRVRYGNSKLVFGEKDRRGERDLLPVSIWPASTRGICLVDFIYKE